MGVGDWARRARSAHGLAWDEIADPATGGDPHGPNLLRAVASSVGRIIAVGGDQNSMIMSTTDGVTWEEDLHPAGTSWLGGVAYVDGVWVAAGGNGLHMRSTDEGATWNEGATHLSSAVRALAAGEGRVVAAGDGGSLAVSNDAGQSWQETVQGSVGFSWIGFGHGVFVATGSRYNGSGFDTVCQLSDDGQAWSACPFASARFGGVAFGDDELVVVRQEGYASTQDGNSWDVHDGVDLPELLVFGDGRWVGVSDQRRYVGTELADLSSVDTPHALRAVTFGLVR